MAPLNIHPDESATKKRKNNKALKIVLGIGALIAVPAIGTTLAATININTSGTLQFGQGAITTAACDTGLNLSTTSSYSGDFKVKTITISDIDLTTGCEGKTLTISAANSASPSVEGELISGTTQISFTIPATAGAANTDVTGLTAGVTASAGLVTTAGAAYKTGSTAVPYDDAGKITLTITTPNMLSSAVSKFLIQSS